MKSARGLIAISLMAASGCGFLGADPALVGSGTPKEETREVAEFTGVDVGSAIEATVVIGPKAPLKIRGDDNVLPLVKTEVKDGHLVATVDAPGGVRTKEPLKLTITLPRLDFVAVDGAAKVEVNRGVKGPFAAKALKVRAQGAGVASIHDVDSDDLEITADGAGQVEVTGLGKKVEIKADGASKVNTSRFKAETAEVEANGAARVEAHASKEMTAGLGGASNLKVFGKPLNHSIGAVGAATSSFEPASPPSKP